MKKQIILILSFIFIFINFAQPVYAIKKIKILKKKSVKERVYKKIYGPKYKKILKKKH